MNERIRELAEQATTIEVISGRGFDTTQYTERFSKEKFAELIIKECVSVINTEAAEYEDNDEWERAWKMGTEFAVYQIKEHFGVEE